ncbi:MAG: hypothetical protein M3015_09945 [Bacteroidota bacterium]|nr:hypothetical protein [Bacteroidota bacterium]
MLFRNLLFFVGFLGLCSCKDFGQTRFQKIKWMEKDDIEFPYRKKMLNDLITNYKLAGRKKDEIINLLGEPNYSDSNSFAYKIIEDYGFDIDPVYTKNLDFQFAEDSTITSFKIEEWKK